MNFFPLGPEYDITSIEGNGGGLEKIFKPLVPQASVPRRKAFLKPFDA